MFKVLQKCHSLLKDVAVGGLEKKESILYANTCFHIRAWTLNLGEWLILQKNCKDLPNLAVQFTEVWTAQWVHLSEIMNYLTWNRLTLQETHLHKRHLPCCWFITDLSVDYKLSVTVRKRNIKTQALPLEFYVIWVALNAFLGVSSQSLKLLFAQVGNKRMLVLFLQCFLCLDRTISHDKLLSQLIKPPFFEAKHSWFVAVIAPNRGKVTPCS